MSYRNELSPAPLPTPGDQLNDREFRDLLTFNAEDGRIWLADRRMMLMDVAGFAAIRQQLIDTNGVEAARRFLTTTGFHAGVADAELLRRRWPNDATRQRATSHPFLGITRIQPVTVKQDPLDGRVLEGEWIWQHCVEADAQIQAYGLGTYPACWMEVGYAVGFSSRSRGSLLLFREVACRSMGSPVCRVIGKSADQWSPLDREETLSYLDVPLGAKHKRRRANRSAQPPETVALAPRATGKSRDIVGRSAALKAALELLHSVAETDATVLITGESGVGKELFTQRLHSLSRRAHRPFVAVNCAAIPDTLIEAELFGVERGAFTGATHSRPGRFERAAGGTLFLDEVVSLNPVSQAKLLRALQEGEVERIGSTKSTKVDVRVVAATNASLSVAVEENRFREDLFFRLNVFPIHLPPLRERRDDIPALLEHYLDHFNRRHGKSVPGITHAAMDALLQYPYPGNIRELENLVERAVILAKSAPIDRAHLFAGGEILHSSLLSLDAHGKLRPLDTRPSAPTAITDLSEQMDALAGRVFAADGTEPTVRWPQLQARLASAVCGLALQKTAGNISAAARLLGMERHQLAYHLRKDR